MNKLEIAGMAPTSRWFVYGRVHLNFFFPKLARLVRTGGITPERARVVALAVMSKMAREATEHFGTPYSWTIQDVVAEVEVRMAPMKIVERWNPALGSRLALLRGVIHMIVRELVCRRQPPRPHSLETWNASVDGNQLRLAEKEALAAELRGTLGRLSSGERGALLHEFGRFFDFSSPIGPRRRPRDPDALPRAVALLQQLMRSD